jgi:hypothetical protein
MRGLFPWFLVASIVDALILALNGWHVSGAFQTAYSVGQNGMAVILAGMGGQ